MSGSGVSARAAQQLRGDAGQEVPAAARGQERTVSCGELRQVLVGPLHVAEGIACRAPPAIVSGSGLGSSIRSDSGSAWPSSPWKRLVQQVIEDLAVELGLLAVVVQEGVERRVDGSRCSASAERPSAPASA